MPDIAAAKLGVSGMNQKGSSWFKRSAFGGRLQRVSIRFVFIMSVCCWAGYAYASSPGFGTLPVTAQVLTSVAVAPNGGFWIQLQDVRSPLYQPRLDGTYVIDGAPSYSNYPHRGNIVGAPRTTGYWIVTDDGQIISRGGAPDLCEGELSSCSNFPENPHSEQIIVGAAATPSGQGLWAVSRDGSLWTAGDARPYGDVRNQPPITGIVGTLSGNGYYIVASDGGVFSFGDAVFYGSTGGNRPGGHEVTGIALSINASSQIDGYWLVADDGGVFTFGHAPFWGSSGGNDGGSPVISIASFPSAGQSQGYAWVHADGRLDVVTRPIATTFRWRH
jgi:hypothetical protein